jgi:hypothetical protein
MNFKQWFEGGGGFINQSMTDPVDGRPPAGYEISADPYMSLDGNDLPPTKNNRKRRKPKFASFIGIRKEIPSNYFI